jgi:secreted PhoX family phosphatase
LAIRLRVLLALVAGVTLATAAAVAFAGSAPVYGPPLDDPNDLIDLPAGYTYSVISESCVDDVTVTETGTTADMPSDFDGNAVVNASGGRLWLLSNHELTEPRPGDWQGDALDCTIDEQAASDDGDSDAWGSVSRITLAKDGVTVLKREVITTGLHNLCAAALTPWGTFLTNEEFPYARRMLANDPQKRSGWVWEIDPATGKQTKLTGMGFLSHEQEAFAAGAWYETDDQGDWRFIYRFVPDRHNDLTQGTLYGLKFDRTSGTGVWIGPLDPMDPHADMVSRGINPDASTGGYGFQKAEGIVADHGNGAIVFSESGAGSNPGNVWRLTHLTPAGANGEIIVAGDTAKLSRPDNLRTSPSGDLFIYEDGGVGNDQIWVLPKGETGAANLLLFANVNPALEPTGPWFSADGKLLYMSLQGGPENPVPVPQTSNSRVIAISGDF